MLYWLLEKVQIRAVSTEHPSDQFLKACSFAGIKLDFKALESVGLSLDLLKQKESNKGINRPVWLNADILRGPNVPSFVAPVNGSGYEILARPDTDPRTEFRVRKGKCLTSKD